MFKFKKFNTLLFRRKEVKMRIRKAKTKEKMKILAEQNKKVMERLLKKVNQLEKIKVTENY